MSEQGIAPAPPLRDLAREVTRLRKAINAHRGRQVHSPRLRDAARDLVQMYFRTLRPLVVRLAVDTERADTKMQRLLQLAGRSGSTSQYKKCLQQLSQDLSEMEIMSERQMSDLVVRDRLAAPSKLDSRISATLEAMLPSTAYSYQQVLIDLNGPARVSYRGTATELREILRETLDHLAPDKDVMTAPDFKLDKERTKPTMTQKAKYILQQRGMPKNSVEAPKKAIEIVESTVSSFVRSTYDRGSIDTHTVTGISRPDVLQLKMYVDSVLCELLEIHRRP